MVDTRGRFVWYELMTTDARRCPRLYTPNVVVGWNAHDACAAPARPTRCLLGF